MKGTWGIISALVLVALSVGAWLLFQNGFSFPGVVKPSALSGSEAYEGAPLSADYRNEQFRFALDMPDGFTAGELPRDENGGTAIILQNEKGEGIQIYVTDADPALRMLSAEDIRAALPDMRIEASEVVQIGSDHQGVAFLSDNEAFGGASREVWFYFGGNLYQISTYERLDSLLKAMFATWQFQ